MVHIHGRLDGDGAVALFHAPAMRAVMGVAALPMSIWPAQMSYLRPSSISDFRPVMASWSRCGKRAVGARGCGADRAVVDDASALRGLVLHDAEGGLGAEEGSRSGWTATTGPVGVGEVLEQRAGDVLAGVVEQHVEPAMGGLHGGEEGVDRGGVGDVGGDGHGARGGVAGEGDGLLQRVLAAAGETTDQPPPSKARAAARPTPVPAPVTTATFVVLMGVSSWSWMAALCGGGGSVNRAAAGDVEDRAGREGAILRGQPACHGGDFLDLDEAVHRDLGAHPGDLLFGHLLECRSPRRRA